MRYALAVFAVALTGCMVGVESEGDLSPDGGVEAAEQALVIANYTYPNSNGGVPIDSSNSLRLRNIRGFAMSSHAISKKTTSTKWQCQDISWGAFCSGSFTSGSDWLSISNGRSQPNSVGGLTYTFDVYTRNAGANSASKVGTVAYTDNPAHDSLWYFSNGERAQLTYRLPLFRVSR